MFPSDRYEQTKNCFGVDHWPSSQMNHHKYRKSPKHLSLRLESCHVFGQAFITTSKSCHPKTLPKVDFLDWHYLPKCPEPIKFSLVKKKVCKICFWLLGRDCFCHPFRRCALCCFSLGMNFNVPISCICVCVKVTKKQTQNCEFGPQNSGPQRKTCTNISGHQTNMAHIAV